MPLAGSRSNCRAAILVPRRILRCDFNIANLLGGPTLTSRAKTEYRYEKLTWPEINDAIELGKVCILPCGAVEQHGHHLPLDVDLVCPGGIAQGAGRQA